MIYVRQAFHTKKNERYSKEDEGGKSEMSTFEISSYIVCVWGLVFLKVV